MSKQVIVIPKDYELTEAVVAELQKEHPFLTNNRILEIEENHQDENGEVTATIIDVRNKTTYPFAGTNEELLELYPEAEILQIEVSAK